MGGSCGGEVTLTALDDITGEDAPFGAVVDYAPARSISSQQGGILKPLSRLRRWFAMFDPDFSYSQALDIPIEELAATGTRALILDLENTLVRYKSESLPADIVEFLDRA
ncbi:MAG: hypothetical protein DCC49_13490, partial [Acidobacteria bacterium]